MLQPKKTKYRHMFKNPVRGISTTGNYLAFGDYGIKAVTPALVTARQIEAARRAMTRYVKRTGKVWIRIFPQKPITKKPSEVKMGKGKGNIEYWAFPVRAGRVLFEISGVPHDIAKEAMRRAGHKLPCKVRFIAKEN